MKSRGKSLLLCALLMLFGCGNKMTKEQRAEYDALLQQRDSIENVRISLFLTLTIANELNLFEDPDQAEEADKMIKEFQSADQKNDSLLNDYQTRFPGLPKPTKTIIVKKAAADKKMMQI